MKRSIAFTIGISGLVCVVAADWFSPAEPFRAISGGLALLFVAVLVETWEARS